MSLGRVLVIDDDGGVGAMLRDILSLLNYESAAVSSPIHGLRLVPVYRPDVILLDVWMPELLGADVLHVLRRDHADIPVVMVTANEDEEVARELLQRGAFDYVRKPLDIDVLARILQVAMLQRGR